jgi:hypothetical protein
MKAATFFGRGELAFKYTISTAAPRRLADEQSTEKN